MYQDMHALTQAQHFLPAFTQSRSEDCLQSCTVKCWEGWNDILVYAVALPIWRGQHLITSLLVPPSVAHLVTYICPEMQYFSKANFVHNNILFVIKTALHIIGLKCKKRKGLNRHKFLFCHFGNFCFMFVWLRVSSYFLGPFVLS